MPGSSAAVQRVAPSLGRLLASARAQRSEQRPERAPELPVQRRQARRISSFPPKQSWPSPPGRPWRSTDPHLSAHRQGVTHILPIRIFNPKITLDFLLFLAIINPVENSIRSAGVLPLFFLGLPFRPLPV